MNHKVSIFYRTNNRAEEEYRVTKDTYEGMDIYKINNTLRDYSSLENIYKNTTIEDRFLKVLDEVNPDIVHIHHLLFLSTGIIKEIKKRNIPIIFTLHDYWLICPRGQLLKANLNICKGSADIDNRCLRCLASAVNLKNLFKKICRFLVKRQFFQNAVLDLRAIYNNVDLFIAPSNFLRKKFIEFGLPPEKIIYSDNGMNLDLFKDVDKIKSDKIRLGFIGTLIPSKGVHVLIKAFNNIKNDKAILKIYGKAPVNNGIFDYSHKIKRMAGHNKNIRFMGIFDNKDAAEIFREIDVLIVPSLWEENSPLVLHEAILTKTPVIASNLGGVSELIEHTKNGLLFKAGDSVDLFAQIQKILEIPYSAEKIKTQCVKIKDIEDNCKEIENIYNGILN